MGIEFNQIHNLVRTYQRILNFPRNERVEEEAAGSTPEDKVSISSDARELEAEAHRHDKPRDPVTGAEHRNR